MDAAPKPRSVRAAARTPPRAALTRAARSRWPGRAGLVRSRRSARAEAGGRAAPGGGHTGVEEYDGTQAAQLRLVHLHVPHLGHELRQHPAGEAGQHRRPVRLCSPPARAPPRPRRDPRASLGEPGTDLETAARARPRGDAAVSPPGLARPTQRGACSPALRTACTWDLPAGGPVTTA